MTIVKIKPNNNNQHEIQFQSDRKYCWLKDWIEVPINLEAIIWDTLGFCDLVIEDNKLIDIIPTEQPVFEEPIPEPSPQEDTDAMLIDQEYRLTLLELGGNL